MGFFKVYTLPAAIAVLLHAFVALFLFTGFGLFNLIERKESVVPLAMQATLIVREQKPKPTQLAPQAPATVTSDTGNDDESEQGIETDLSDEDLERMKRFEELRQSLLASEIEGEIQELEANIIDDEISLYVRGIYTAVVENWSRPPSASNDMEARLLVELYPSGDLISVGIVKSSGNDAFDRSAEAAVRKAVPFELPSDANLYTKRFRTFHLRFKPTDLLK